jgi:hypothetical protein
MCFCPDLRPRENCACGSFAKYEYNLSRANLKLLRGIGTLIRELRHHFTDFLEAFLEIDKDTWRCEADMTNRIIPNGPYKRVDTPACYYICRKMKGLAGSNGPTLEHGLVKGTNRLARCISTPSAWNFFWSRQLL